MTIHPNTSGHLSAQPQERNASAWSAYACPETRAALRRQRDELVSAEAARPYKIRSEIPCFLRYDPAEDSQTAERLCQLNELAHGEGWQTALEKCFPQYMRYVTDTKRLSYIDLLPLTAEDRVLELGSGLGQHTSHLAARAKSVHALEVVSGQAAFTLERCRQLGATNVSVACGGDDCRLPYREEAFDVAVVNLVFEWCATRRRGDSHAAGQRELLADLARVLKPGGLLYLATKNRYSLRLLLGKCDEHVNYMRFGNALPRWLMRLGLLWKRKTQATGLLHSYTGLRRMLVSSGFEVEQSFWAVPGVRYPERFINTDAKAIRQARRSGELRGVNSMECRVLNHFPAGMVKHFTPGLAFLARKIA